MDKVEKVARAMCKARGHDPDAQSPRAPVGTWSERPGSMTMGPLPTPRWHDFEEDAKVFLAAYEAASE